jgi:hypothetical protein
MARSYQQNLSLLIVVAVFCRRMRQMPFCRISLPSPSGKGIT